MSYLRQTVRTNLAEFVADNADKPVSVVTVQEVEARYRQIAHLSEFIPIRYMQDRPELERFLVSQLQAGLADRLEEACLNGDDTVPSSGEFDGPVKLAGAPVAFDTDIVTTASNALFGQLDAGENPTHWVFNSANWAGLSLARADAAGAYLYGVPANGPGRQLLGVPVILGPRLAAGSAMLIDRSEADILV